MSFLVLAFLTSPFLFILILDTLMKSNVDMQQQIRDLQLELLESKREKEMERIGMELYDDKQILTEVYQPLKERFIREGEAYAIAHGLILEKEREDEKEINSSDHDEIDQ